MFWRATAVSGFRSLLRWVTGSRIASGPFQGMKYLGLSVGSVFNPKILGSYECELHPVVFSIARAGVSRCVDIGAAEGFYAVGLARLTGAQVVGFEIDPMGQELIRRLAAVNGVSDRVSVRGRCEPDSLQELLTEWAGSPAPLIVCDVEGFEDVLLDPGRIPALRACPLLIEVHDAFVPGVGARLCDRFQASHEIERIDARARTSADFPQGHWWGGFSPTSLQVRVMDEGRPFGMYWLWCRPRSVSKNEVSPLK